MGFFVNICGPVVADTAYSDGRLVARDTNLTLPEVVPMTADLAMMGTFSMPVWQLIEHMEAQISKIGVDKGLRSILTPGMKALEFRWVQTVTDVNGSTREMGCKAFLKGMIANLPEIAPEVGSATEHPCKIALVRYNLFADGQEMWLVDRLAGRVRIAGRELSDMSSML